MAEVKKVLNIAYLKDTGELVPIYSETIDMKLNRIKNPYNIPIRGDIKTKYYKLHRNLAFAEDPRFLSNLISRYMKNNEKFVKESPFHTIIEDEAILQNTVYILKEIVKFLEEPRHEKKIQIYNGNDMVFRKYIIKNYTNLRILDFGKKKYKYIHMSDKPTLNKLAAEYSYLIDEKLLTDSAFDIGAIMDKESRVRVAAIKITKDSGNSDESLTKVFKILLIEDL